MVDKVASGQVFSEYFGFPLPKNPFIPPTSPSSHSPGADIRCPADCPRSSNRNETESFMEVAKAPNWAVEPQEKKRQE
jgi:hypothetical protein